MIGIALMLAAAGNAPNFHTGNTLYAECTSEIGSAAYGVCTGYIEGIFDYDAVIQANLVRPVICTGPDATIERLRDAVVQYLKDHPEARDQAASTLINIALHQAFPCPDP